ncbi:DNA processing protein [Dethiosulfatibacter aminovorans DSM 17477]|uniref:DNA processing protein n=1 Tax=Dethiosulfatibacter aminovorans DSM 17477 TaxID=1121476 RepID=A0A1M6KW81_9FIRM|nr:DNA-processing protein DprA [Dethiosulfatibacter aminovorans]SHJ63154.1 DNA processing protein [Dethiosulfatibacter aminovorans DSM 17477]
MHYSDVLKLNLVEGLGRKTILKLKESFSSEFLEKLEFKDMIDIINEMTGRKSVRYDYDTIQIETEKILEKCYDENIRIYTCFDDDFPEKFKEIGYDSPVLIFVKGDETMLHDRCNVAVVGTRNPSKRGFDLGVKYSEALSEKGISIISGLALGCDTAAHTGALNMGGRTLVTLPSGIGNVYPRANIQLYNDIMEKGGCIISENNPGEPPRKYDFINRDRLQAALSEGVLIMESSLSSGTFHTYNYSIKYNKKISCSIHEVEDESNMELNEKIRNYKTGSAICNIMDLEKWIDKLGLEVL